MRERERAQVSGMCFEFDPSRKAGERLVKLTVAGKPVDDSAQYTVALREYIGHGNVRCLL